MMDWLSYSAPALRGLVFSIRGLGFFDGPPRHIGSVDIRHTAEVLVNTCIYYSILPILVTRREKTTLLLYHDFPEDMETQVTHTSQATADARTEYSSRLNQLPYFKVIWGGMSESYSRIYLTVTELDNGVVHIYYQPRSELAHRSGEPDGESGLDGLDVLITAHVDVLAPDASV
ncbi:hypothetical protein GY45DRAFT_1329962 [Cubamyces sp. BRFM 1775]|nr:hypothetical protein GY45DRAFT_1329962 [Cubamyces sp. BRFM 1775]